MNIKSKLVNRLGETGKVLVYSLHEGSTELGRSFSPLIDNNAFLSDEACEMAGIPYGSRLVGETSMKADQLSALLGRKISG